MPTDRELVMYGLIPSLVYDREDSGLGRLSRKIERIRAQPGHAISLKRHL